MLNPPPPSAHQVRPSRLNLGRCRPTPRQLPPDVGVAAHQGPTSQCFKLCTRTSHGEPESADQKGEQNKQLNRKAASQAAFIIIYRPARGPGRGAEVPAYPGGTRWLHLHSCYCSFDLGAHTQFTGTNTGSVLFSCSVLPPAVETARSPPSWDGISSRSHP